MIDINNITWEPVKTITPQLIITPTGSYYIDDGTINGYTRPYDESPEEEDEECTKT